MRNAKWPARATTAGVLTRYLARLKFPKLFLLTATLFVIDLVVPDIIPLADELLLGLGTALLSAWKRDRVERRSAAAPSRRPDEAGDPVRGE